MGDSVENPKNFLHGWLGARNVIPEYNIRTVGIKTRSRFLCEVSAQGYSYKGMGNSLNKKDAGANAARDFIQYLIRSGFISQVEVKNQTLTFVPSELPSPTPSPAPSYRPQNLKEGMRPVFGGGQGPSDMGQAYRRRDGQIPFHMMDAQNVADAEELDVNGAIHGNWTIDNAKGRLHQFMQMNQFNAEYVYSMVGPAHQRSFRANMSFYVRDLGRKIHASETGSTKQIASKSCALSLVRQLYHLGVIEPFTGSLKRSTGSETVKPFETSLEPALMRNVESILSELGVIPKKIDENLASITDGEGNPIGISLLQESAKKDIKYDGSDSVGNGGVVSWSPPLPNWNPWTNCNIDEGHMSTATLEQLSSEFLESFRMQQQTSEQVQKMLEHRMKLPVYQKRVDILEAISENQVILIKGETGSGKTTQICQFILDDYIMSEQGAHCNVVVTQPRRISAISLSERIAAERGEDLGQTVGYSVRFESCLPRPYASIMFCTVGVLLRKLEGGLRGVSHVIVDEIHERDVNSDFILIVLRDMLAIYHDLRVILMSATIDTNLFTEYFNSCPVLNIKGREFSVSTFFLEDVVEALKFSPSPDSLRRAKKKKQEDGEDDVPPSDYMGNMGNMNILPRGSGYSLATERAMSQISERDLSYEIIVALLQHIRDLKIGGAILIFLPGWNVIFGLLKHLQSHPVFGSTACYALLPLHSQLPREDNHRVFQPVPSHMTKIILATNIAETSITIDDVVFVIDSCKAKIKLFTSHNNMTSFETVWASKSNLMQRKGRAGRVQEGFCYHLCSKARFESLEEYITPEIMRTPLHEIALSIKLLRLGGIGHFLSKAPDPPTIDTVIEAQVLLTELNCLDENSELTPLGKILAKLPLDPRLGKMIILGTVFNCADPLATIAAQSSNLSEVFTLGPENRRLTPVQRSFAAYRYSDHLAILNAFQQWDATRERVGIQGETDFCLERMLSLPSLRATSDAKNQLLQVLIQCGFPEEQVSPHRISFRGNSPVLDVIAALLCTGLYPNVCYHKDKRKVLTQESKTALIHKASVNCTRFEFVFPYPFFVFGEKIRTRAVSCKQMTIVSPIDLLLFGAKKVEFIQGMVRLDNWINLQMSPKDAAAIVALRPAIENLVTRAVENPNAFFPLEDVDLRLVNLVTELSKMNYDIGERGSGGGMGGREGNQPLWGGRGGRSSFDSVQRSSQDFSEDSEYFEKDQGIPEGSQDGNSNGRRGIKRHLGEEPEPGVGSSFIPLKKTNYASTSNFVLDIERNNPVSSSNPPFRPRFGGQQRFSGGSHFRGGSPFPGGGRGFPSGSRFGSRDASPHRGWNPRGNAGGRRFSRGGFRSRWN